MSKSRYKCFGSKLTQKETTIPEPFYSEFIQQFGENICLTLYLLGNFHAFCHLFFQNQLFRKTLSVIPSECQTVCIQIRPDIFAGLILVQTVCKGYQQTTLVDNSNVLTDSKRTHKDNLFTVNVLKFRTLVACQKGFKQTWQTRIRLLQKQSDQGLPCLLFWQAFCEFQPWKPTFYFRIEIEKCSKF